MDRRRVWPDFRAEHVLHEDDDVIVIHKPAGVSSQAADAERPDDVVTRLAAYLGGAYLGVHQRLDRDTSGAIVFTKRREANAALARQLEGRTVQKRYIAGVVGWPKGRRAATLDDDLAPGDESGVMVVVAGRGGRGGRGAKGKRAVTHVKARQERAGRALLDVVLETGRTHQARVQLAHAGAPIAGDPIYGGSPAPRLMLHAASIELEHPRTKKRLVVRDDAAAPAFDAWLARGDLGYAVYDDDRALARALDLAVERRWGLGRSADRDPPERRTTAFRLVHEEGDALPGLAVDVYGDHLVAQLYLGDEWDKPGRRDRVLDALGALGFDGVYLKLRPRQANVLVDTRRDDLAPKEAVRGASTAPEIVVYEEGVAFAVRLGDGLSTGLFLDQRGNRRLVRELAQGRRVANLFAYTCGFSIVAALGGAASTVSVDAAAIALERGRAGFLVAGTTPDKSHTFAAEDVFAWLERARKKGERFDLVIVDPPSYSSTKKRRFVAESDYGDLVAAVAAIVAPGGRVLACANHRGMARARLRRMVHSGVRAAGREVVQLKDLPDSPDHPAAVGREAYMKSVLLTLE